MGTWTPSEIILSPSHYHNECCFKMVSSCLPEGAMWVTVRLLHHYSNLPLFCNQIACVQFLKMSVYLTFRWRFFLWHTGVFQKLPVPFRGSSSMILFPILPLPCPSLRWHSTQILIYFPELDRTQISPLWTYATTSHFWEDPQREDPIPTMPYCNFSSPTYIHWSKPIISSKWDKGSDFLKF